MQTSALTVSDLNEYVRRSLAGDPMLRGIAVRGEISNFKPYASGHWYFTLKDAGSRLNCVMFRQYNMGLRFMPREGMTVVLRGSAGLYVQSGSYQFYAEGMQEDGVGALYQQFLASKERLMKEGTARYPHRCRQAFSGHSADPSRSTGAGRRCGTGPDQRPGGDANA